jgi:hypothetical protein
MDKAELRERIQRALAPFSSGQLTGQQQRFVAEIMRDETWEANRRAAIRLAEESLGLCGGQP